MFTIISMELLQKEYKSHLSDFMFPAKPIITHLTIIADENKSNAEAVVRAIKEHILQVGSFNPGTP